MKPQHTYMKDDSPDNGYITNFEFQLVIMKKLLFCLLALLGFTTRAYPVTEEPASVLNVYYPEFSRMDLVCGKMPDTSQKNVEFCCEAAFTGELLDEFKHMNIADNHICKGEMKKGYRCRANTGGFVWGNGKWKFMMKADFPTTAKGWNMGFCQLMVIKDGTARPISSKMRLKKTIYRALCEKDGRLCIIEAKKAMTYESFVKSMVDIKVKNALYLDMGSGWNYAWYRDKNGKVKELFPASKLSPAYKYRTNWVTFYKD